MEMTGVLQALHWAGEQACTIYSDSQYVVNGLNKWSKKWARNGWKLGKMAQSKPVKNRDLWVDLTNAQRPQHALAWVRGHNGDVGNERADYLAENARMCAASE
jgi:ribonuclease HI